MNRVLVLSSGGEFTHRLLDTLEQREIALDALVLYVPPVKAKGARARVLAPLRWLKRRLHLQLDRRVRGGARRVIYTGPLNSARMERDLRRLAPDVVVLARCGLIDDRILAVPAGGVVNVHPGLLPWIRGNSPFGNSLLRDIPLGSTAFRVDPGIDTGAILQRRLVRVAGTETHAELRDALFRLWVEMTADWIAAASTTPIPAGAAQAGRFPICRTIGAADEPAVARRFAEGMAKRLFDRWSPLCAAPDLALPADAQADFLPRPDA
jgi:methionyl-tRNA formyltransferase